MTRQLTVLLLFLAWKQNGFAQKQLNVSEQVWLGYVGQARISDKWGILFDANIRTRDNFTDGFSVSIIRPGLMYYLSENTSLAVGYAYGHYFAGNDGRQVVMPEHRPWQQIMWSNRYPKMRLQQRLRLEERFRHKLAAPDKLGEGYNFNYRVRYNFSLSAPVGKKPFAPQTFSFVFNDEAMLNFGKEIIYNTFDQNRLFLGFNYHVSKISNVQVGYMNTLQQQVAGRTYKNIHTIRINFQHNIDLRKTKETGKKSGLGTMNPVETI